MMFGTFAALKIPDYIDKFTPEFEKKHQELVRFCTQNDTNLDLNLNMNPRLKFVCGEV